MSQTNGSSSTTDRQVNVGCTSVALGLVWLAAIYWIFRLVLYIILG